MNWCRETTKLGTRLRDWAERSEREEDGRATWQPYRGIGPRRTWTVRRRGQHPRTPGRTATSVVAASDSWNIRANSMPLWACNWEGIWLVSIHKWPFATISTSIFGISCAPYVKYASAQSLDFLDLAANCSFMNWKLQLAPSGVSGWTLVSFQANRNKEFGVGQDCVVATADR